MRNPRQILDEREAKDKKHLDDSVQAIESYFDELLDDNFDGRGLLIAFDETGRSLHPEALNKVISAYKENGWIVEPFNTRNWMFMPAWFTPDQRAAFKASCKG